MVVPASAPARWRLPPWRGEEPLAADLIFLLLINLHLRHAAKREAQSGFPRISPGKHKPFGAGTDRVRMQKILHCPANGNALRFPNWAERTPGRSIRR